MKGDLWEGAKSVKGSCDNVKPISAARESRSSVTNTPADHVAVHFNPRVVWLGQLTKYGLTFKNFIQSKQKHSVCLHIYFLLRLSAYSLQPKLFSNTENQFFQKGLPPLAFHWSQDSLTSIFWGFNWYFTGSSGSEAVNGSKLMWTLRWDVLEGIRQRQRLSFQTYCFLVSVGL